MSGLVVARRFVAHGRVQGVFLRDSVRRRAAELGVAGWVTNRRDGAVEGVFEGETEQVESMIEFCRRGPGRADVTELEVSEEPVAGLTGFEIR